MAFGHLTLISVASRRTGLRLRGDGAFRWYSWRSLEGTGDEKGGHQSLPATTKQRGFS